MRFMMLTIAIGLAACGQTANKNEATNTTVAEATVTEAPPVSAPPVDQAKVTKAQVEQLKEGMTYEEVKAILGREGEVGNTESYTEQISWANNDGSSLQTTFRDGKLVTFTDFGMK